MPHSEGRGFSPAVKLLERGSLAPEAAPFNRAVFFMRELLLCCMLPTAMHAQTLAAACKR